MQREAVNAAYRPPLGRRELQPNLRLTRQALHVSIDAVEQLKLIQNHRVGRIELIGFQETPPRLPEMAALHHRVTEVVHELPGLPRSSPARLVGEIEAAQLVELVANPVHAAGPSSPAESSNTNPQLE